MQNRLERVRLFCKENHLDAILISTPANITYLTSFSFAMGSEREAFVFITPQKQYIISSHLYKDEILRNVSHFIFIDFFSDKEVPFWKLLTSIIKEEKIAIVGFESDNLTVAEHEILTRYHTALKGLSCEVIREKKDREELRIIQYACKITDNAFTHITKKIKPGMTEKDLAYQIDSFIRKHNGEPSFRTIVAFGKNSAVPHHATDNTVLQKKDIILLDFGVQISNYCSDMSRTIFLGKPTDEEKKLYHTVRISQQKALDFLKATTPIDAKEVDTIARNFIVKKGYPSFPHSLGHSIGINVHDGFGISQYSKNTLHDGMVFSVEPGIYLTDSIGVRIEDTVAIIDNTLTILTTSTKQLLVL